MKNWLRPIILFLISLGTLGAVVMISGLIPISASSGHWPITAWILEFSMKRSVSTYTLTKESPHLEDQRMIQRGAGHYEIGCKQCHGGVEKTNIIGLHTTPKIPHLPPVIKEWKPEELFRIVKHGVKFTGMPAWPSLQRDDEVWSMVAFLLQFPKLDWKSYQKLVHAPGSEKIEHDVLRSCSHCHGLDGNGRQTGAFPLLSGQNAEYLENSLKAYAKGERHSGTMKIVTYNLESEMLKELALHYSKQKRRPLVKQSVDQSAIEEGSRLAKMGIPEQHVASCIGCHGPDESGLTRKPYFPDLRGQPADYITTQLDLFLKGKRGGSEHVQLMHKAVHTLTELQIKKLALYFESLEFKN